MLKITEIIPQRPPFLFIDQIDDVVANQSAKTTKNVTIDEWFFREGTTMQLPMFVLTEMMAQTGALTILADKHGNQNALFGGIQEATQHRPVVPGDVLHCEVKLIKQRHGIGVGEGQILCEGQRVFSGTLMFVVVEE